MFANQIQHLEYFQILAKAVEKSELYDIVYRAK
jgi:hypothetical protein